MDLSAVEVVFQVVVVFGLIVFIHELGHFSAAKWVGVGVERFSLGFGPKLLSRKVGETEYLLSAIPLGGYVKMVGEEVGDEVSEQEIERSFNSKSLWERFLIVSAGPLANLGLALVVFTVAFSWFGISVPSDSPKIGGVVSDMPAEAAGFEAGDEIVSVDGIKIETWEELAQEIQNSDGERISIAVKKLNTNQAVVRQLVPQLQENPSSGKVYVIGIQRVFTNEPVSAYRALGLGIEQTWLWTQLIVDSVIKLFSGQVSTAELGGPILIAQVAGEQARLGTEHLLRFTAVINVNLAIFNLLPIPVLDGGHLLLLLIELLIGRPLTDRTKEMALKFGFVVIASLVVLVFYNDISRLVS